MARRMTDRQRIVEVIEEAITVEIWDQPSEARELALEALAALEAAGYAIYERTGWEVTCPQCEEAGEVVPHDADADCDLCVRGEFEGHTMDCPTCLGRGVVGVVPVGGDS